MKAALQWAFAALVVYFSTIFGWSNVIAAIFGVLALLSLLWAMFRRLDKAVENGRDNRRYNYEEANHPCP